VRLRTILNRPISEHLTKMANTEGAKTVWDLAYSGLTDAEMSALEDLFAACEGRLRPFVFVDPLGNLLRWTEDWSKTVWQTGMLVATEVNDPNGGVGACQLTNGAHTGQSISQSVDSPAHYRYTFSVWARSTSTAAVRLALACGGHMITADQRVSGEWELISVSGEIGGAEGQISCSVEVPGGGAIDVFGPQLDAQSGASGYRMNADRSGLYTVRFDQDEMERLSHGPDNHSTRIRILTVQE
jgi:hypothetical protein